MNVCNYGHDYIAYTSRECPLCQAINDYETLAKSYEDLEKAHSDLEDLYQDILDLASTHAPELLI